MRRRWVESIVVLLALHALAAPAAALSGSGALADAASSTALLRASCFDDGHGVPVSLVATIEDVAPVVAPFVSVQLVVGNAAANATDPTDADAAASPAIALDGGAGEYTVFVDKSGAGEEAYVLTLQCMTGSAGGGVPTGTFVDGFATPVPAVGVLGRGLVALALVLVGALRLRRGSLALRMRVRGARS